MEVERKKLSKPAVFAIIATSLFLFSLMSFVLIIKTPMDKLNVIGQVSKSKIFNSFILNSEAPENDLGPQILFFSMNGKKADILPAQLDSLEECYDRAKEEVLNRINNGEKRTIFGARCRDVETGKVHVIGKE